MILDYIDGDVAREKNMQSALGAWLDPFFDKVVEGGILIVAGFYYLKDNPTDAAFFTVTSSIVVFHLCQFSLVMDQLILAKAEHSDGKSVSSGKAESIDKYSWINPVMKHCSLGHSALVTSFILGLGFGLIEKLSPLYLVWSSLTIVPVLLAKGRHLLRPSVTQSTEW